MISTTLLALTGIASSAPAHTPEDPSPSGATGVLLTTAPAPIDSVSFDEPGDGRLWVRGADYKASFGADGATFIPFLGSDAPRNFPTTFDLSAVTLAGDSLLVGAPEVSWTSESVTLARGVADERYEIGVGSIEQTFVFHELAERGELELRIAVDSELEPVRDGAGWRFEGPFGGMDYGAATAVDASGATQSLTTEWRDGELVITVPEAFVAAAALPLVVDPVLSAGSVADLAADELSADVAYDPTWDHYLVVVEYVFSQSDSDVRAYQVSGPGPGTLGGNGVWIDTTTAPWRRPRVACRNVGNAFMIVATVGDGLSRYVGGRVRDVDVAVMNPQFVVSGSFTDSFNPDIGGDARSGFAINEPAFVVVWEKAWIPGLDHDLYMRSFNSQGQPLTPVTALAIEVGQELSRPVISKSAGRSAPYEYMTAWERSTGGSTNEIQGRRVTNFGAAVGSVFDVATTGFNVRPEVSTISSVTVAGQSQRASVIVFVHGQGPTGEGDIAAVVCSGSTPHQATNLTESEGWRPSQPQRQPSVSCDGDQWTIVYAERYSNTFLDFDMFMLTANLVGDRLGLTERHRSIQGNGADEGDARIASKWESGGDASPSSMDESFVVWSRITAASAGIAGAHLATTSGLACGYQYCEANPNSIGRRGWLTAYGDDSTTGSKTLIASSLPPNVISFVLTSASTNFVQNVAGSSGNLCLGPVGFGRYSNFAAASSATGNYVLVVDPTQIPQPTGSVAAAAGQTWYFQCWHRDSSGAGATSNMTNAIAVPFQ